MKNVKDFLTDSVRPDSSIKNENIKNCIITFSSFPVQCLNTRNDSDCTNYELRWVRKG